MGQQHRPCSGLSRSLKESYGEGLTFPWIVTSELNPPPRDLACPFFSSLSFYCLQNLLSPLLSFPLASWEDLANNPVFIFLDIELSKFFYDIFQRHQLSSATRKSVGIPHL